MKHFKFIIPLFILLLSGCAQSPAYKPGAAIPPGKILVIAQLDLLPGVKQGTISKTHFTIGAPAADEVRMYMSTVADVPVNKEAMIPFSQEGATRMNLSFTKPSVVLMDPGVRYIRMGEFTLSANTAWRQNAGGEMRGGGNVRYLTLYGDLKLNIPANAKAVYIGTLQYDHDGVESKKVRVVDNFKNVMKELDEMKFGISSKDVVKRLAKVVRAN